MARRAAVGILVVVMIAGCSLLSPAAEPTGNLGRETRVITGVDATHTIITQPLAEVIPDRSATSGSVVMTVGPAPVMLGIEGTMFFLAAAAPDGARVADRVVSNQTETWLPAGKYTLETYYRTCDGSCALLDPAVEFCSVDAEIAAAGTYLLAVEWSGKKAACTLGPRPSA